MQVNKILKTHSKWLWANGYKTEAKDCIRQANHKNDYRDKKGKKFKVRNKKGQFIKIKELKRTGVQIMPRAIPCTSSCDPRYGRGSLGAFALLVVGALNLGGLL